VSLLKTWGYRAFPSEKVCIGDFSNLARLVEVLTKEREIDAAFRGLPPPIMQGCLAG